MTQHVLAAANWLNLSAIVDYFRDLKRQYQIHKNIRQTIKELSELTDKELHDIGISRGMIHSIAHEAYYDNLVSVKSTKRGWF